MLIHSSFGEISLENKHLTGLLKLMNLTGADLTQKYREWKYRLNSPGLVLLAQEKSTGRIGEHYALVKWNLWNRKDQILVVQSVDTIVNPYCTEQHKSIE